MQRIERYGVIALVLFLVTIVAVSFWDDGNLVPGDQAQKTKERLAGRQGDGRAVPSLGAKTQAPRKQGSNARSLPATSNSGQGFQAERNNSSLSQTGHASRGQDSRGASGGGRKESGARFETLPATAANQERSKPAEEQVVFPESLTTPDPRTQAKPNQTATNYDSIQERSNALARESQRLNQKKAAEEASRRSNASQPAEATAKASPGGTYTVQPGDTLSEISFKTLGTSKRWREIQSLNGNLDPSHLKVDMVLNLPGDRSQAVIGSFTKSDVQAPVSATAAGTYSVRKGDVLSQIAQDQLGGASRWREIAALNPTIDPNRLMEGAVLRMPTASAAFASLTTTPQPSRKKNRVR